MKNIFDNSLIKEKHYFESWSRMHSEKLGNIYANYAECELLKGNFDIESYEDYAFNLFKETSFLFDVSLFHGLPILLN